MIGIFDSGSGGLTVLRAIRDRLPTADVIYFGDIRNAPYGSRSREELSLLTVNAIKYLQDQGATRIVSACNSVSASLAISLFDAFSLTSDTLVEMVGPTVGYFRHSPARLLLCATPATIESGIYQNGFHMIGKDVTCIGIPELAGAIEFGKSEEDIESIITHAFQSVRTDEYDAVVLACTHYPLVRDIFQRVLGESVVVFDPAEAVADRVEKLFWPQEAGDGRLRFVISQDSVQFRALVEKLFGRDTYEVEVTL
jgi:glutamate racemase